MDIVIRRHLQKLGKQQRLIQCMDSDWLMQLRSKRKYAVCQSVSHFDILAFIFQNFYDTQFWNYHFPSKKHLRKNIKTKWIMEYILASQTKL